MTDSKLSVYCGAPLFSPHHRKVLDQLTEIFEYVGYEVFSPLEESKHIWNGRAPKDCSPEERCQVVNMNYRGIRQSDLVFVWLGGWSPAQAVIDYLYDRSLFPFINQNLDPRSTDEYATEYSSY